MSAAQQGCAAAQVMPNGTCVLVGDDEAFLREAQALAVERLGCKLFTKRESYEMSSHMQGLFNQLPYEQRCPASLHLLSDMELLGHTDYFVGAAHLRPAARHRAPAAAVTACRGRCIQTSAWLCEFSVICTQDIGLRDAGIHSLAPGWTHAPALRKGACVYVRAACCCLQLQPGGRSNCPACCHAAEQGLMRRLLYIGPDAPGGEDALHAVRKAPSHDI